MCEFSTPVKACVLYVLVCVCVSSKCPTPYGVTGTLIYTRTFVCLVLPSVTVYVEMCLVFHARVFFCFGGFTCVSISD